MSVVYKEKIIGTLTADEDSTSLGFSYSDAWIKDKDAFPLSPTIGFDSQFTPSDTTNFFKNILPEGKNLTDSTSKLGISRTESFELLKRIGIDLTAAFSLIPQDSSIPLIDSFEQTLITQGDLQDKIDTRGFNQLPFGWWNGKMRISMAGFQEKIGVKVIEDLMYLPEGYGNHSSHILKPIPDDKYMESMIINEAFCMEISRKIGLDTAHTKIINTPAPFLLIERFDRALKENGNFEKKHQIDGCQLLNLPPNFKMERPYGDGRDVKDVRDGATIYLLAHAIQKHSETPLASKRKFIDWIVFQVSIGNSDAHAKNIGFFVNQKGKIEITPFYDQVCTTLFSNEKLDTTMSMAIDDNFMIHNIGVHDIANMCYDCDFPISMVSESISRIIKRIREVIELDDFETSDEFFVKKPLLETIMTLSQNLYNVIGGDKGLALKDSFNFVQSERNLDGLK